MKNNAILTTLVFFSLLSAQMVNGQKIDQHKMFMDSEQSQLDETCNIITTNTGQNTYAFAIMPSDKTPNAKHYYKYFKFDSQTKTWNLFLSDSLSTPSYVEHDDFLKEVKYRVQHYIVANDKNRSQSNIFEAEFIVKKSVEVKVSDDDALVLLSRKNIQSLADPSFSNSEISADSRTGISKDNSANSVKSF